VTQVKQTSKRDQPIFLFIKVMFFLSDCPLLVKGGRGGYWQCFFNWLDHQINEENGLSILKKF
jgi:hypothetical protein